jgi:hypothetical protein
MAALYWHCKCSKSQVEWGWVMGIVCLLIKEKWKVSWCRAVHIYVGCLTVALKVWNTLLSDAWKDGVTESLIVCGSVSLWSLFS